MAWRDRLRRSNNGSSVKRAYFDIDKDFTPETRKWAEGGCGVLAYYLHKMTGWPLHMWCNEDERNDPSHAEYPHPDHVFVQHPSGQALDARGLHPMPEHAEPLTLDQLKGIFEAEALQGWPDELSAGPEYHSGFDDGGEYARQLLNQLGGRQGSVTPLDKRASVNSRTGMAERSGIPELDAALEEFMRLHPEVNEYRDPQQAWGYCQMVSEECAEFLRSKGFEAYESNAYLDEFGRDYADAKKTEDIGAGDFTYPEHSVVAVYNLPGMGVNFVTIDFTAAQYGFTEFPKVHGGPSDYEPRQGSVTPPDNRRYVDVDCLPCMGTGYDQLEDHPCQECNETGRVPHLVTPWEPGQQGKGNVYPDGSVEHWQVGDGGNPHHADVSGMNVDEHKRFDIEPDGTIYPIVDHLGQRWSDRDYIAAMSAHPRFKGEGGEKPQGYGHGPNLASTLDNRYSGAYFEGLVRQGNIEKTADKLNGFLMNPKSRPDLQTPEGQAWLETLQHYHNEKTDALMPWLTREWKKGRIYHRPPADGERAGETWRNPGRIYIQYPNNQRRLALPPEQLNHWADWYRSNHPTARGDIMQKQMLDVHGHVGEWDEYMKQKANEEALGKGDVVHAWPDNWTLQRLTTPEQCSAEGDAMGHCVGGYGQHVQQGRTMIYSLRDHNNSPHVTMEITPNEWEKDPTWLEKQFQNHPVGRALPDNMKDALREYHGYGGVENMPKPVPPHLGDVQGLYNELERDARRTYGFGTPKVQNGTVVQIQGRGNQEPRDEYKSRLRDWFHTFTPDERPSWDEEGGRYDDEGYPYYSLRYPDHILDQDLISHGAEDPYGLHSRPLDADYEALLKHIGIRDYGYRSVHDKDHVDRIYQLAKARGEIPELGRAAQNYDMEAHDSFQDWMHQNYDALEHPFNPDAWDAMGDPEAAAQAERDYDDEVARWSEDHPQTMAAQQLYQLLNRHKTDEQGYTNDLNALGQRAERHANILDPIKDSLDPAVFDDAASPTPSLRPALREWLIDTIFNILEQGGYEGPERWASLYLTGSLTTYQYSEHSDCDVSLFVNHHVFPEWSRAEMIGLMVEQCDDLEVPGTHHPLQVYVVAKGIQPSDLYHAGLRSAYDIMQDDWVVAPERDRAHDVEYEDPEGYAIGLQAADKMERLLRYEPDKAITYYRQLHRKRMRDQAGGKGDYATSNLIYKMLDNRGLFDELRKLGVKIAGFYDNRHDGPHLNPQAGLELYRGEARPPGDLAQGLADTGVGMHWTTEPSAVVHPQLRDLPSGPEGGQNVVWHATLEDPSQAVPRNHPMWNGKHRSMDWENEVRLFPQSQVKINGAYVWRGGDNRHQDAPQPWLQDAIHMRELGVSEDLIKSVINDKMRAGEYDKPKEGYWRQWSKEQLPRWEPAQQFRLYDEGRLWPFDDMVDRRPVGPYLKAEEQDPRWEYIPLDQYAEVRHRPLSGPGGINYEYLDPRLKFGSGD